MSRSAYAAGYPARRRRAPSRGRPASVRRGGAALGWLLCLVLTAAAVLIERLEAPAPAENWARAETRPADAAPAPGAVRVVDGDTLDLGGERVRISNIDAPEMPPKSRCPSEAEGALAASARLEQLVRQGPLTLERTGEDRYGRTLARVYVDGADAGEALIAAGLVRPWEGRRRSWCAAA